MAVRNFKGGKTALRMVLSDVFVAGYSISNVFPYDFTGTSPTPSPGLCVICLDTLCQKRIQTQRIDDTEFVSPICSYQKLGTETSLLLLPRAVRLFAALGRRKKLLGNIGNTRFIIESQVGSDPCGAASTRGTVVVTTEVMHNSGDV